MYLKRILAGILFLLLSVNFVSGIAHAEQFKIAIMQDKKGSAAKFKPLVAYMKKKGIDVKFVGTPSYPAAAKMFAEGKADAMFSGSGVAGSMIIKDVAYPAVRPLGKDGTSTYWALIVAPKGSPKYMGSADYFRGKKVLFCSLASSGEFFFRSIGGHNFAKKMMKAKSHGAAIDALSKGAADAAVVKNRVWNNVKDRYPNLEVVGQDIGENPNGTLIMSKNTDPEIAEKVTTILLGLMEDSSPEARKVKGKLNVMGYIKTTDKDFSHTLALLGKAGVDKSFNFKF